MTDDVIDLCARHACEKAGWDYDALDDEPDDDEPSAENSKNWWRSVVKSVLAMHDELEGR